MTPRSTTPHGLNDESRQFSLLVNSVTDYAIYMLDPEGVIRTWNPGGQRIKGYLAEDVIGTNFARFYLPEEVEAGLPQRNLQTAATEGRYVDEGWRLRQDGTRFRASVVIDPIYENGELLGFAKITRDITERHTAQEQLEEAQQSLLQAQKMEAIGKFTLGLAHDFNNLLTIIANCLDLLSLRVKDGALASLVDTAQRAIERGALLTRQLLTFGRGQALAPEELTLAGLLEDIQPLLQRAAGGNIRLSTAVPASLPALELDRSQLEAAILNLVCNSRDALPNGGNIEITASAQPLRDPSRPDSALQTYVCVAVKDDGEGISLADQARVFEPFFTTKPVGRGSGLGLSQVFGFTSHSKGFTQLDSTPGEGTRVTLCFPVPEA